MGCQSSKAAEPGNKESNKGTLLATTPPAEWKSDVLVFEPGCIGMEANWQSGVATSIVQGGQAERLGVKESWQFHTLHEGGMSEAYSKDRLDEFIAGKRCYCLTFTKATAATLGDCTKPAETPAPPNEKLEVVLPPALEVAAPAEAAAEPPSKPGSDAAKPQSKPPEKPAETAPAAAAEPPSKPSSDAAKPPSNMPDIFMRNGATVVVPMAAAEVSMLSGRQPLLETPKLDTAPPLAPPPRAWVLIADWSNFIAGLFLTAAFFQGALFFDQGVTSISIAVPSWFQFCFCAEGALYTIGCFFMIPIMAHTGNAFGSMQFAILTIGGIFFSFSGLIVPACIQSFQDVVLSDPCTVLGDNIPGTPKVWNAFGHFGITCFMVGTSMGQSGVMSLPKNKMVSPFWGVTFYTMGSYTIGIFKFWGPLLVGAVDATWPWWMGVLGAVFLSTGALIFGLMDGSFGIRCSA